MFAFYLPLQTFQLIHGAIELRMISEFYIPTMEEMMALLAYANSRYAIGA